jgi:hypothetical protein
MHPHLGTFPTLLLAAALAGCTRVEHTEQLQLPAAGVWSMFVDDDRGDLSYSGTAAEETFDLTFTSWGKGSSDKGAARKADGNLWGAEVREDLLDAWGRSESRKAGVDIDVVGPHVLDVEAYTVEGAVALYEVDGFHYLTGTRVVGERVYGDVDAYAEIGGIDLQVYPYDGSVIRLEVYGGDLVVSLPAGLPYDLDLAADPAYGYELVDLGFDQLTLGPGYALGHAGAGTISVQLLATGGTVTVRAAPPR